YGLGTTVGAGIYVLVGEVAATAGSLAPLSFLVAALLASATAFSFGELSARYPKSAGEAVYVNAGFKRAWLAALIGLMVVAVGTISSAAIANGFAGYARQFVDLPPWILIIGVLILLTAIAVWGITESVTLAAIVRVLEIGGLLLIVAVGANAAAKAPLPDFSLGESGLAIGVLGGAVLAFYAFLGFEDMINVVEETRDPGRTMPRAIVLTLIVTTVLYIVVAGVAVLVVPIAELAMAEAPLAAVYEHATGRFPAAIGVIGTVAVINGALVQIIMASRVLYGLARAGWLPKRLAALHPRTQTPLFATLLVGGAVMVLAVALPLVRLAEATSVITLLIFALVNAALWRIKMRDPAPAGLWCVPLWVPVIGFFSSLGFVIFNIWRHAL
ncbi:MAG: amino acid permease, partial [Alphaproteobacteria bacterium]|nr:amino acid permease [Alphaproteobacteria bacterium]